MEYLTPAFTLRESRLWWQRQGLSYTASGYGSKIPTGYLIKLQGEGREYRVYAVCYSNAASFYIVRKREKIFIRDSDLEAARYQYRASLKEGN